MGSCLSPPIKVMNLNILIWGDENAMTFHHPLDRTIVGAYPLIRHEEDIEAIEAVPLSERCRTQHL